MNRIPTRKQSGVSTPFLSDESVFQQFPFLRLSTTIHDRYEVFEINEGGFAYVLGVSDLQTHTRLAVKIPKQYRSREPDSPVKEFAEEVAFWVNLGSHLNIVTARFVQGIFGRPALFMDYIDGPGPRTVRELLRTGPLTDTATINFAYQLCLGMEFANREKEIVHLDLKPENLLLQNSTTLKITDFGLSHHVQVTGGSYVRRNAGSWPYAPPELFRGEPCDTRSDMFSLGVILYEMITGNLPYPFHIENDPTQAYQQLQKFHARDGMDSICEDLYHNGLGKGHGMVAEVISSCLQTSRGERPRNFKTAVVFFRQLGANDEVNALSSCSITDQISRAAALQQVGEHHSALSLLNQLLIKEPNNVSYYLTAAESLDKIGNHKDAQAFRKKARDLQQRPAPRASENN